METATEDVPAQNESAKEHIVSVRGVPVLLKPGHCGWSAHAIQRGYFPISTTGYRSFANGFGQTPPPSSEALEACAKDFDRERMQSLVRAKKALSERFHARSENLSVKAKAIGVTVADSFIGRHIHLSGAAESALNAGAFAPDVERANLWEVAYQLFDRLARDPLVRPRSNGLAWNAEVCERSVEKCARLRDLLARFASGGTVTEDEEIPHAAFVLRTLSSFDGPSIPVIPLPSLDLTVFPSPLAECEETVPDGENNAAIDCDDSDDDDSESDEVEQDEEVAVARTAQLELF